jgi:hypothetical protein
MCPFESSRTRLESQIWLKPCTSSAVNKQMLVPIKFAPSALRSSTSVESASIRVTLLVLRHSQYLLQ